MNISSVSSTSNTSYSSGTDSDVKQLSNQVKRLQSQIKTETQSKDDDKIKQSKIQLLQNQIAQIEAQIQAKKSNQKSNATQITQSDQTRAISKDSKIDIQA